MFFKATYSLMKLHFGFNRFYCNVLNRFQTLKVNNVSLHKYVLHIEDEYNKLKTKPVLLPEQNKRLEQLQLTIDIIHQRNHVFDGIYHLQELLVDTDEGIQTLAKEEKNAFMKELAKLDEDLVESLIPVTDDDLCNALVLEVNTGVGGQEAMLFAKELFEMYSIFAQFKNWDFEIAEYLTTEIGGIRHASALINGNKALQYFKYEAGVHRVQRIPATEKSGRIHTSTVSVLALPQPTEIQIVIDNKDLRIETKRASGAGGQHVNTTDSAVRITHIPTNISVECQVDRSQLKNKALAMQRLRALLYEQQLKSEMDQIQNLKKSQVRSNSRNEKIRTYNFGQDRITDHRLQGNHVHNIKGFFESGLPLDNLINKLHENARIQNLLNIVMEFENK
ncbi:hypothetical protein RN001_008211 [Aquatica leii]|uniref:Prokaryotic-type class I peptide chain release factors domain-containing protein n=1 Tax=Aquatica leii TaxID=1421715 RepID=A0AAN7SR97_9COLE|nr:hypothetical protein RN001_008211 [Aquatica leii]